jgi:hypothetical protein
MKRFKELTEELLNEGGEMYPADDMTMKEIKIACYAAQNILERLENGSMIQRWQISAIVKASEELASVYTSMSADEVDDEEWDDMEEEEPMYVGFEYPSMYGEETDYEVDVEGLPKMYVKADNPSQVKNNLRKVVKNPDMIRGVERVAKATLQKIFRDKASGKEEVDLDEAESYTHRVGGYYTHRGDDKPVSIKVNASSEKEAKEKASAQLSGNHKNYRPTIVKQLTKEEVDLDEARKSDSYQFTHKPGDAESEKRLADLKKSVKGTGKRVVLQGRLGKDNPNAHKYSKDAPSAKYKDGKRVNSDVSGKSGGHSHQRIQKADASHHDVYVYDRNESVELEEANQVKMSDLKVGDTVKMGKRFGGKQGIVKAVRKDGADVHIHGTESPTYAHQSNFTKINEASYRDSGYRNMLKASRKADKEADLDEGKNLTDTKSDWRSDKSATAKNWSHNKLMKVAKHDRSAEKEIKRRIASKEYVFANEEAEITEASDLRITKVYNKFPKRATYAVHSPDRKYYKEFDSMEKAKAHHTEKTGK